MVSTAVTSGAWAEARLVTNLGEGGDSFFILVVVMSTRYKWQGSQGRNRRKIR